MFDAIIKTNDHFEILTGEERLYFLMNSSDEAIINCDAKYIFLFTVLKENLSVNTPIQLCIALYTRCFPSVCGKNITGDSGGIRTHDLLLTIADVLTSRPSSLPDDDRLTYY